MPKLIIHNELIDFIKKFFLNVLVLESLYYLSYVITEDPSKNIFAYVD